MKMNETSFKNTPLTGYRMITIESILNSQIDETNEYFGDVGEFKADGYSEEKAEKQALRLHQEKYPNVVPTTTGRIFLKFKNSVKDIRQVTITENLYNDHYISFFVKKFLADYIAASNRNNVNIKAVDYSSFLSELHEVYFCFATNNDSKEIVYKIEIETLI